MYLIMTIVFSGEVILMSKNFIKYALITIATIGSIFFTVFIADFLYFIDIDSVFEDNELYTSNTVETDTSKKDLDYETSINEKPIDEYVFVKKLNDENYYLRKNIHAGPDSQTLFSIIKKPDIMNLYDKNFYENIKYIDMSYSDFNELDTSKLEEVDLTLPNIDKINKELYIVYFDELIYIYNIRSTTIEYVIYLPKDYIYNPTTTFENFIKYAESVLTISVLNTNDENEYTSLLDINLEPTNMEAVNTHNPATEIIDSYHKYVVKIDDYKEFYVDLDSKTTEMNVFESNTVYANSGYNYKIASKPYINEKGRMIMGGRGTPPYYGPRKDASYKKKLTKNIDMYAVKINKNKHYIFLYNKNDNKFIQMKGLEGIPFKTPIIFRLVEITPNILLIIQDEYNDSYNGDNTIKFEDPNVYTYDILNNEVINISYSSREF